VYKDSLENFLNFDFTKSIPQAVDNPPTREACDGLRFYCFGADDNAVRYVNNIKE
jgi:hypothetical protein